MKRTLILNLSILLIVNLVIKPIYLFGIDRNVQLQLGTENYGIYFHLLNFTLILQVINDFGLQNFTVRHLSQNRAVFGEYFQKIGFIKLIFSFIYILAVILIFNLASYDSNLFIFTLHLTFNQIIISGISYFRSTLAGIGDYKSDSILSGLDRSLLIIMLGAVLLNPEWRSSLSISMFIGFQTISLLISFGIAYAILKIKNIHFSFHVYSWAEIRPILLFCFPFTLIYLFNILYQKIDNILIEKLLTNGHYENGVYAASMRLFEAGSMVSLSFGSLLLGMFAYLTIKKSELKALFELSVTILLIISLMLSASVSFYSDEVNQLLYYKNDPYWNNILMFTMIAFLPASINYIFGAYFQGINKEVFLLKLYGFAAIINIGINLILIPMFQILGAALANLITQFFLLSTQLILVHRDLRLSSVQLINWLLITVIFVLVFGIFKYFVSFHYMINIALSIFCGVILLLVFRLVPVAEILQFMKNKLNRNEHREA
ncbi:MAG: oligosaccharide flippase family protein [Bacteroidota bacterium]|nr:oligosaccharide flippase family protein [Bacteroidota bacterium]